MLYRVLNIELLYMQVHVLYLKEYFSNLYFYLMLLENKGRLEHIALDYFEFHFSLLPEFLNSGKILLYSYFSKNIL